MSEKERITCGWRGLSFGSIGWEGDELRVVEQFNARDQTWRVERSHTNRLGRAVVLRRLLLFTKIGYWERL